MVVMATNDKHSQTLCVKNTNKIKINNDPAEYAHVMYDETIPVANATEIDSPEDSDIETVVKSAMSKFTPPVRHTAKHDFDSDSETDSEHHKFLNSAPVSEEDVSPDRKSLQRLPESMNLDPPRQSSKDDTRKTLSRQKSKKQIDSSDNSDTDTGDTDAPAPSGPPLPSRKRGAVIPAEGAYDPKHYQRLSVPPDMETVFQNIMNYTPQKVDIEFKLQPFTPEYVPAVGDIDAFLKVTTPAANVRAEPIAERAHEHIDNLGLTVLDEPAAEQSDSALLHLQLRALSKTSSAKSTVLTKKIEDAEKNTKAIDRWIKDVSELHLSKPAPNVNYTVKMPDIDSLMAEWPASMEAALNAEGFLPASLDCSLAEYAALTCAMFDVPVAKDNSGGTSLAAHVQSLHVLFTLYAAVRGSQLYAERERERDGGSEHV